MSSTTKPPACCGRSDGAECACAKEATCSCGAKPALQCSCDKASTENTMSNGKTCSCGKRAIGECTCSRAATENAGAGLREGEIDFTTATAK